MFFISACLCFLSTGNANGWATPSIEKLSSPDSPIKLTSDQLSWIASMIGVGGPIAAIFCAYFSNILGRKVMILLASVTYAIGSIAALFATEAIHLYVGRLFMGMGIAITFSTLPVYIGEVIDPKIRGGVLSWTGLCISIGTLSSFVVGSLFSFRILNMMSLIFPILTFFAFLMVPESPYFLMKVGKREEAIVCLKKLKGCHNTNEIETDLNNIEKFVEDTVNCSFIQSVKCLKEPRSIKAIVIVTVLLIGQQFSGMIAIFMYMVMIFEEAHVPLKSMYAIVIAELICLSAMSLSSMLLDRFGRKPIYTLSAVLTIIIQMLLGSYYLLRSMNYIGDEYSMVVMLLIFSMRFGSELGLSTVPLVVLSEIFSFNIKGIASAYFPFVQGLSVMSAVKLYQIITDNLGQHYAHWIFGSLVVFPMIFIVIHMPETKNKSFSEIQEALDGKKYVEDTNMKKGDNDSDIYRVKEFF